jgi:hypothetical protein
VSSQWLINYTFKKYHEIFVQFINLMLLLAGGQFSWQGGEMTMTFKDGTSVPIETNQGQGRAAAAAGQGPNNEEIEVMSTDTSSSSSTDSN